MAIIKVAYEINANAYNAIKELAKETVERDVNWNGSVIKVERDDFTCIDCEDEIAGAQLLSKVYNIIDSH